MSLENVEKLIKDHKVEFVDLRFCDLYTGAGFETLMAEAAAALPA